MDKKIFWSISIICSLINIAFAQKHSFDSLYSNSIHKKNQSFEDYAIKYSISKESRKFITLRRSIDALNAMIVGLNDEKYIEKQKTLIDNLIKTSEVSSEIPNNTRFQDNYRGWISKYKGKSYEVPLYESYSFFYITEFLYKLKQIEWVSLSEDNRKWWEKTLGFVEEHIWTKWLHRSKIRSDSPYRYFLRSRTHMGSQWAGIAMYLNKITDDPEIKEQTKLVIDQYDTILKRNLKIKKEGYIWNSTYDRPEGTFAPKVEEIVIQDVMHGNHVVSYIVKAYEIGNKNWTRKDIERLCFTLKEFIYDEKTNTFHDNLDGTKSIEKPGRGNFVSDGWIRLSKYDSDVRAIFEKFEDSPHLERQHQTLQYKANLHKEKWNSLEK